MHVNGPQVSATMAVGGVRASVSHRPRRRQEAREGRGRTDGDGAADARLAVLDLEVGEEDTQDVLRADGLGDVAERVDGGAPNRLLVRLEEVEQLEADAHPLARRDELCAAVGDAPDEVDRRLLHLLVPVAQDGRHARDCVRQGEGVS